MSLTSFPTRGGLLNGLGPITMSLWFGRMLLKSSPRSCGIFGEPFADSSALPTYYLAKMTREHVTVALNGDAGDETFGGYERYVALGLAHRFDRLPLSVRQGLCLALRPVLGNSLKEKGLRRRLRRFLDALPLSSAGRYLRWMSIAQEELRPHLYSPSLLGAWESEGRGHPLADGYESLVEAPEIENLAEGAMRLDLVTLSSERPSRQDGYHDHGPRPGGSLPFP